MEIMFTKKCENNYFNNKNFIGFKGGIEDLNILLANLEISKIKMNKKVKFYIDKNQDYLKPLGLEESILKMKIEDLSNSDLKLILLIKTILLKPQLIILNNFEIGINDRMINRLVRFIKTINGAFNIKFMFISHNPIFLNKIIKDMLVMKNGIVKYQGNLLAAVGQNILELPEIIKFIQMANEKNAELKNTLEEKELLKDIYRSVN